MAEVVKDRASGITLSRGAGPIGAFGPCRGGFLLIAALKGPIRRLVAAMRDLRLGRSRGQPVSDSGRADEIGEMARALDVFKSSAIDKVRVEDEVSRDRETRRPGAPALRCREGRGRRATGFCRCRRSAPACAYLSRRDLASTIDTPFTGELDSLPRRFQRVHRPHCATPCSTSATMPARSVTIPATSAPAADRSGAPHRAAGGLA